MRIFRTEDKEGVGVIDICMLSCNRVRLTAMSIEEIHKRTLSPFRLTVMDNGSIDDSPEILRAMYADGMIYKLMLCVENTGVHYGFNELLAQVSSEPYYICTDADLIPAVPIDGKDWIARLIELMETHPDYGAIACRPHILIGEPGDRFDNSGPIRDMSHIGAHLRIMDTALVREVGGWRNVKAPSRNNEDWWIGGKIREAGRKVGYSRDIRCIHFFGDPTKGEDPWGYPVRVFSVQQALRICELLEEQPPFGEVAKVDIFIDGKLEKDRDVVVTPRHEVTAVIGHGHVPRWPPVHHYSWRRQGIDWFTCEP